MEKVLFKFWKGIVMNMPLLIEEAVQKIIASPKTSWEVEEEVVDIRKLKDFRGVRNVEFFLFRLCQIYA